MKKQTVSLSGPAQRTEATLPGLIGLWSKAAFLPTPATYTALLSHPQATARHAYLQIAISGGSLALAQAIIQISAVSTSHRRLEFQGILASLVIASFLPLVGFAIYVRLFILPGSCWADDAPTAKWLLF